MSGAARLRTAVSAIESSSVDAGSQYMQISFGPRLGNSRGFDRSLLVLGIPGSSVFWILFDFDSDFLSECLGNFFYFRKFNILRGVLNTGYCTFRCSNTMGQFLLSQSTFRLCFSQNNTDLELLISGVGACLLPLSGALFAPREHGLDSPYRRSRGQLEPPHLAHDRQYSDRGDDRADRSREEGRYSPVG